MTPDGVEWQNFPGDQTPYIHWFATQNGPSDTGAKRVAPSPAIHNVFGKYFATPPEGPEPVAGGVTLPLPDGSHDPEGASGLEITDATREGLRAAVAGLTPDTVITGVIDSGIALGHARFRNGLTQTRLLASWQQAAPFDLTRDTGVPFGEELFSSDINRMLAQHIHGGWLDETAFNRDAHLSMPETIHAPRDLEFRAAHGTHVLDLAAGQDNDDMTPRPIIAVNLPDRFSHGSAGHFLEIYALFALDRIAMLADEMWRLAAHDHGWKGDGFRVVVNLSFGMQAGPKDGSMYFEQGCAELIRKSAGRLAVVLPAGNDNLEQCHAHRLLPDAFSPRMFPGERPGKARTNTRAELPWRISPADETCNFLEIWATQIGSGPDSLPVDFDLALTPPSGDPDRPAFFRPHLPGGHGGFADICNGMARVYVEDFPDSDGDRKLRLLICLRPTETWGKAATAEAGLWHVSLRYDGDPAHLPHQHFAFHIQSDQSLSISAATGRRSYLDHPRYHGFTKESDVMRHGMPQGAYVPTGQRADTYHAPDGTHLEHWRHRGPVQRKGSLNALASAPGVCAIGGFVLRNGEPAGYSATTRGDYVSPEFAEVVQDRRAYPTAAFPSDISPARPGLRAAGALSGGTAVFQGTSMAAALATRYLVDACRADSDLLPETIWLERRARVEENDLVQRGWPALPGVFRPKTGGGRVCDTAMATLLDGLG